MIVTACSRCGSGGELIERPNGPHIEIYCEKCNRHVAFRGKQDAEKKKRRKKSTNLAVGNYCHACLRHRSELRVGDTLGGHHVIEVQDGGSDSPKNIWTLCTSCHQIIHWMRTYHGGNRVDELVRALCERGDERVTDSAGRL